MGWILELRGSIGSIPETVNSLATHKQLDKRGTATDVTPSRWHIRAKVIGVGIGLGDLVDSEELSLD